LFHISNKIKSQKNFFSCGFNKTKNENIIKCAATHSSCFIKITQVYSCSSNYLFLLNLFILKRN